MQPFPLPLQLIITFLITIDATDVTLGTNCHWLGTRICAGDATLAYYLLGCRPLFQLIKTNKSEWKVCDKHIETYFFKVHSNIVSHLRLGPPNGLFPVENFEGTPTILST